LRDIRSLYGPDRRPFYAGFGNRFTDQISYRTVDVPRHRIFTINSNAEVSLDLLSLNTKLSYVNMSEVVDHYFPPVSTLVKGGGEEYTDFKYWRDTPLELDEFSASDSEDDDDDTKADDDAQSEYADEDEEEVGDGLVDSYISNASVDEDGEGDESLVSSTYEGDRVRKSIEDFDDPDDEEGGDYDEEYEDEEQEDVEEDEQTTPNPMVPEVKPQDDSKKTTVKDVNAELITGVTNLSMEK
jgi:phosphatidate phosphatase LPIN